MPRNHLEGKFLLKGENMGVASRLWKKLKYLMLSSMDGDGPVFKHVMDRENFLDLLRKERNRSDRKGHDLSVLVFRPDEGGKKRSCYTDLIMVLETRLRQYDSIGWFDNDSLAVLLPETSQDDALRVCNDIHSKTEKRINCEIIHNKPEKEITR